MRIPSTPRTISLNSHVEWSFIMESPNPPNIVTRIPAAPRKMNMVGRIAENRSKIHSPNFEEQLRAATRRLSFDPPPAKKSCLRRNRTPNKHNIQVITMAKSELMDRDSGLGSSLEADKFDLSTPTSTSFKDDFECDQSILPLNKDLKTLVKRKLTDDYEFLQSNSNDQDSNNLELTN